MFELFLPYMLATAMGIAPDPGAAPLASETAEALVPDTADAKGKGGEEAAGAVAGAREPETQSATGRFTTAIEVKPILTATKPQWVAVREYDGQDLLYFTNLLAWRCGLWEVRYGLNGAPPDTILPIEPCDEDTAQPNAMVDTNATLYITAPLGSIESIDIEIDYDDGTMDAAIFARQSVLMPG